jgi:hypothetical protein
MEQVRVRRPHSDCIEILLKNKFMIADFDEPTPSKKAIEKTLQIPWRIHARPMVPSHRQQETIDIELGSYLDHIGDRG